MVAAESRPDQSLLGPKVAPVSRALAEAADQSRPCAQGKVEAAPHASKVDAEVAAQHLKVEAAALPPQEALPPPKSALKFPK